MIDKDNNPELTITSYLNSEDPLSDKAIEKILEHKEEDVYVDYKEEFEPTNELHWHGITTDAMAFANTLGGYIIYGVRDSDFSIIGVSQTTVEALTDTNMVMQKFNRYVSPHFSMIRTKAHNLLSGHVVAMYIPESKGKTHMFVKEFQYKYPSGKIKSLAYPGMIYFRRSATNNIVSPEDLEFIINRRIEHYKESIMSKIAKVIEAPADHQILVFDPTVKTNGGKTYYISDSPDAIPVKGMSFTIVPSTYIEELCGWISLSKRDPTFRPS